MEHLQQAIRRLEFQDNGMTPNMSIRRQINALMQSANPPSLTGGIGNQCPLPQQFFLDERHWQFRQDNPACQPGGNIGVGEHCDLECSPGYQRASGEETLRCDAHILPFAEPAEPLLECEEIQDIDYDNLDREAEDLTPYRPENWERPNQIASNLNYGVDDPLSTI